MNSSTMIRTTVASVANSASRNRLFWKLPIGLPKALRSLAYCSGQLQHCLHRGGRHDRDREPLLRQVLHQVDEAHALLAEQVLGRHLDVGEGQLGGVLGVQADLVEVAAALEALHAALDDQQREALRALVGVGLRDDDHQVGVDAVGDERLRRR